MHTVQARIQEFSSRGGGVQHPKKFDKQTKKENKKQNKKEEKRTQRGWDGASSFILRWYGLNLIEPLKLLFEIRYGPTGVCPTQKQILHNSFSIV